MSILVVKPGLSATVQDLGRYGFQKEGVIVSGAMDELSFRAANLLAGNHENSAALEITIMGTCLQFQENHLIAVTGGNLAPYLDGVPVPSWRPVWVKKGTSLTFTGAKKGCRAYVAVAGGIAVPDVMGSKSTYIRAGIGGFRGRALKTGDVLLTGGKTALSGRLVQKLKSEETTKPFAAPNWYVPFEQKLFPQEVKVMKGPEFHCFSAKAQQLFWKTAFTATPQSDRMGYRLGGPALELTKPFSMLSEAVAKGTIQVPGNGHPIVLLADRQTTGGYPRIGQIAAADLPAMAQKKPGDRICFKEITIQEAEKLLIKQEQEIALLQTAVQAKTRF